MKKVCPKCNVEFECKADDIKNCECKKINLSLTKLAFIKDNYEDCLCKNCLEEIEKTTIFLSSNQ